MSSERLHEKGWKYKELPATWILLELRLELFTRDHFFQFRSANSYCFLLSMLLPNFELFFVIDFASLRLEELQNAKVNIERQPGAMYVLSE